jgi:hypothetical protein
MGLGQSTTRGTAEQTARADGGEEPPLLRRLAQALLWELRAELYPKWVKERLPVPDPVASDQSHLFEDVQFGALILKLPLAIGLALAPLHSTSHQWLLLGLGGYVVTDFLFQFLEQSRGAESWFQRRRATLAAEIVGVGVRLVTTR